ncbi:hypothetical protein QCA50_015188 [Cerrena zonata]|uniref:ADP/ATP carrier receptor n=1 Tax=Cerrena zonata TaxID=2478898 RepID=A0AAW0FWU7_9APHY
MSSDASSGVVDRVSSFISENKKVVLVGAALTVAAVGAGVYFASTSRGSGEPDAEKADRKKKKSKSSKKKKTVKDTDGPILEEVKPKVEEIPEDDTPLTEEELASMSTEDRSKAAASLKAKGNAAYQAKQFTKAADLYTRAIAASPTPEPVFYSNRAACYVHMSPPDHEKIVHDCDAALALDKRYVKALNRRASALEALERYEEALADFTAATILDKFQTHNMQDSVERVLKLVARRKADEILATREPRLPSDVFVAAYFGAFRPRPLPTLPESPSQGDSTLLLSLEALQAGDYIHSLSLVNEALEQGISFDLGKTEALNVAEVSSMIVPSNLARHFVDRLVVLLRFLMGDVSGAKDDLMASVELVPSYTQSWVKMASVYMEQGDSTKAFDCFEEAIKQNAEDPDIYYHRGQVYFITNEFDKAAEDYTKSTSLDNTFVFSHIQLAVAQYKAGNVANGMATFRRTLKAFPDRSEPANYYGELLLDQQRFDDAIDKFDRAIELELAKPKSRNVLPMVNKGLTIFQSKQDIAAAEELCKRALEIDPECEPAVGSLAQLALQTNRVEEGSKLFWRQAEITRSEPELMGALTYHYATKSQIDFLKAYPEMATQMGSIAQGLM